MPPKPIKRECGPPVDTNGEKGEWLDRSKQRTNSATRCRALPKSFLFLLFLEVSAWMGSLFFVLYTQLDCFLTIKFKFLECNGLQAMNHRYLGTDSPQGLSLLAHIISVFR